MNLSLSSSLNQIQISFEEAVISNSMEDVTALEEHQLVKIDQTQDVDKDLFQDSFKKKLILSDSLDEYEAILSLNGPISHSDRFFLNMNNIEILSEYSVIYALHIKGTAESLLKIKNLGTLNFIEENALGKALMHDVTTDFQVRKVWQVAQGYGYNGDPNTAIAILDTGIDDTHPDANFNVVYWADFVGADSVASGDEYATPTDKGEHGTHCASIAASKGASSSGTTTKYQDSGFYPSTDGYGWFGSSFYIPTTQTVTLDYTWEGGGTTYAEIYTQSGTYIGGNYASGTTGGTGSYSQSLSPGWYKPAWGTKSGATSNYYSAQITFNSGWTNPYSDGRGAYAGVAPDSNIVGLKILDDVGVGPTNSLLNALQWLYDYGQSYNVTVASMSIGWPSVVSSIDSAVSSLVRDKGIVCVVAAGNSGTSSGGIYSPGSCSDAITVGAVNKASEIAYYSSNGHSSQIHAKPDVVAPGGSYALSGSSAPYQPIIAADSNDADEAYDLNTYIQHPPRTDYYSNNYRAMQGTSMATPFVAGLVQLVIDAMKQEGDWDYSWDTAKRVKSIICMTASEVRNIQGSISTGGETYDGDSDGIIQDPQLQRTEKDLVEGWGLISVEGAIQAVTEWLSVGTTDTVWLSGNQNGNHVVARQINLESDVIYRMDGYYVVSVFIDADLLLFDSIPDQYGDPVLIANCTFGPLAIDSTVFTVPRDDTYYLVVKWIDGNYNGQCSFTINEVIRLASPVEGSVLHSGALISFTADTSDIAYLNYQWDGLSLTPLDPPFQTPLIAGDGIHTLTVQVVDVLVDAAYLSFSFITDDTAPVITITGATNDTKVNGGTVISIQITEVNLDQTLYNWNSASDSPLTSPYEAIVPETDGEHVLSVYADDLAGNSKREIFVFRVGVSKSNFSFIAGIILLSIIGLASLRRKKN